jgi:hypothetical protein
MLRFLDGAVVILVDQGTAEQQEHMRRHLLRVVSRRKKYLFGCACCGCLLPLLNDVRSRKAIQIAERYIDGLESDQAWMDAVADAFAARDSLWPDTRNPTRATVQVARWAAHAAMRATFLDAREAADECAIAAAWACLSPSIAEAKCAQARLFRDIFGNPFRPADIDPSCQTPKIIQIARTIYDEPRFGHMPILADALVDAGCTGADILDHCRQPGELVRGCWVVDLLLGKS